MRIAKARDSESVTTKPDRFMKSIEATDKQGGLRLCAPEFRVNVKCCENLSICVHRCSSVIAYEFFGQAGYSSADLIVE